MSLKPKPHAKPSNEIRLQRKRDMKKAIKRIRRADNKKAIKENSKGV